MVLALVHQQVLDCLKLSSFLTFSFFFIAHSIEKLPIFFFFSFFWPILFSESVKNVKICISYFRPCTGTARDFFSFFFFLFFSSPPPHTFLFRRVWKCNGSYWLVSKYRFTAYNSGNREIQKKRWVKECEIAVREKKMLVEVPLWGN